MIYFSTAELQELFVNTEYAPKRWFKNALTDVELRVIRLREENRRYLKSINWSPKNEQILFHIDSEEHDKFFIPTLNAPDFFYTPLESDLITTILKLFKNTNLESEILKILLNADLNFEQNRFYCLEENASLRIFGNSKATIGNLLCLAHEIGHCLFEVNVKGDELGSEVNAFQFEDYTAKLYLNSFDLNEWSQYKGKQDSLNFRLAQEELNEFETGVSARPIGHLFFRESLITTWGYQYINCLASLERRKSKKFL